MHDVYDILDRALNDNRGVRIRFGREGDAIQLRLRIHEARHSERRRNRLAYDPGHEMHNRSIYDGLVLRIREDSGEWYLYIEHNTAGEVESLSDIEREIESGIEHNA